MKRITLAGLAIHAVTEAQAVAHILSALGTGRGGWVITPNLDHLRRYRRDPQFAAFFEQARLVVPDGMPLIWASRLQGTPLPARVPGSSLIWTLSAAAAQAYRSIFLLGGDPGTAQAAAETLVQRHPGLQIAGTACPPMGFDNDPAQFELLRQHLLHSRPDIVFVGLGSPKQERLIARLRGQPPQAWWLGVGISFSFVCGRVPRAPIWMQRLGLEWLHRLIQEPRRLARRYLLQDLPFVLALFAGSLAGRLKLSVSEEHR